MIVSVVYVTVYSVNMNTEVTTGLWQAVHMGGSCVAVQLCSCAAVQLCSCVAV